MICLTVSPKFLPSQSATTLAIVADSYQREYVRLDSLIIYYKTYKNNVT